MARGRSRGILVGLGSAAIAAWTAAIFCASELTHCSPEPSATWANSATGSSNGRTLGNSAAAAAGTFAGAGWAINEGVASDRTSGAGCASSVTKPVG